MPYFFQDDEMQRQPTNEGEGPEDTADMNDDESMGCEDDGKSKVKTAASKQNEKLYAEEGMLNTKLRRAEKKKRKKANKATSDAMDGDYDFKVDYFQKGTAMDADESGDDEDQLNSEQAPSSGMQTDE